MKIIIGMLGIFLTLPLLAGHEYYPEERNYTNTDRGYRQYAAPSLYDRSEYVLTFDDGPHATNTPKLLDILKKYNVKATFFIVTERLNASTLPILKRMVDEGHIVASHDHKHDNANESTQYVFQNKIELSLRTLNQFVTKAGHELTTFIYRFPYGAYGNRNDYHHLNVIRDLSYKLFGSNCIQFAFWDIDSSDWVPGMTPAEIFQNLKAQEEGGTYTGFKAVRNSQGQTSYEKVISTILTPTRGGVILQHDIHERSVLATEQFLKYASENNILIKELTEAVEYQVREACYFQ